MEFSSGITKFSCLAFRIDVKEMLTPHSIYGHFDHCLQTLNVQKVTHEPPQSFFVFNLFLWNSENEILNIFFEGKRCMKIKLVLFLPSSAFLLIKHTDKFCQLFYHRHTQTQTQTHTHTHTYTHLLSLYLTRSKSYTHPHTVLLFHTLTLFLSYTHSLSFTISCITLMK